MYLVRVALTKGLRFCVVSFLIVIPDILKVPYFVSVINTEN